MLLLPIRYKEMGIIQLFSGCGRHKGVQRGKSSPGLCSSEFTFLQRIDNKKVFLISTEGKGYRQKQFMQEFENSGIEGSVSYKMIRKEDLVVSRI